MNPVEESPGDKLKALAARARAAALPWLAALRDRYLALDRKLQIGIAAGAGVLILALALTGGGSGGDSNSLTFAARRGNLDITVLEGGALEALQSQEIRSRVRDRSGVKILSIVRGRLQGDRGRRGRGHDPGGTRHFLPGDNRLSQEIAVETSEAAFIERRAAYEIQLNTNMTQLNDARQQMRFARLDFEKFLGADIVNDIIARAGDRRTARGLVSGRPRVLENAETARTEAENPKRRLWGCRKALKSNRCPRRCRIAFAR